MTRRDRRSVVVAFALASLWTHAAGAATDKSATAKHSDKPAAAKSAKAHASTPAKTASAATGRVPMPRPRPTVGRPSVPVPAALPAPAAREAYAAPPAPPPPPAPRIPLAMAPASTPTPADIAALRQTIDRLRGGNAPDATDIAASISDPVARKLAQWIILRSDNNTVDFASYAAFVAANPSWPSIGMFRRRAEAMLWQERADPDTVRGYFAGTQPLTAKGRFALARALLAVGDRAGAQAQAREGWRSEPFSSDLEDQALEMFAPLLTPADHKVRMERRLYADDDDAAMRAARRLGATQIALAKARIAINEKSSRAKALLDAVPADAHHDTGYLFARIQLLRRADRITEAGELMLSAPRDPAQINDPDEWWVERRLLARKLLDVGDARTAYAVARDAATPTKENYRVEQAFTAGWIALRFLGDPAAAATHFARIPRVTNNPISLARAGYWLGRTADAANRPQEARSHYEFAARWTTAYYGQLARARLGLGEMVLYAPNPSSQGRSSIERLELVRALEILYALNERSLIVPLMADLGDKLDDVGALTALGELAERNNDARGMLQLGKAALARGLAMAQYAFPTVGVPQYSAVGPEIDPAIVYAIVRQESAFNPGDLSSANAMGLMQVTPEAGRDTCKRFGCTFDPRRLKSDTVYNVQVGAAELAGVISDYRGSYIMAFAAYNAGRGSVRGWVERYGDPRDPRVDPVDWVERIPFSETRNYVQRVMENLQVYRVRFGGGSQLLIEADLRRGASAN